MEKIKQRFKKLIRYLLKRVLLFVVILMALTAASFLFTRDLSYVAYGERLFWVGLFVFLLAGTLALAHMIPPRMLMFPYNIRRPEDAKKFVQQSPELRAEDEKRIDTGIQIWLIGFFCLAVAALFQSL